MRLQERKSFLKSYLEPSTNMPDVSLPVYMDNHATTRVDPRVLDAMLPYFGEKYGNPGSINHSFGWEAKEGVDLARESIAQLLGASPAEIVFTSGATESNNLAIRGVCLRQQRRGNHIISVTTEHKAVLDPLTRLSRRGFEVTWLPVEQAGSDIAGTICAEQVANSLRADTVLVSIMMANNEIGAIHPIAEIGQICEQQGVLFHCDATQAVGKLPVNVEDLQVGLMSFTAHKIYGPKGIGALYVRRKKPRVKLEPQIDGGGQEGGRRSGTLNVPGIIGLCRALELSISELEAEQLRLSKLRNRLYAQLLQAVPNMQLNGPNLSSPYRLAGNLNVSFPFVDGEALMMSIKDLAVSSGSACTSANPEPSHVLRALGLSKDATRSSLRFGLGRFNTEPEVDFAVQGISKAVSTLRKLSSLT